MFEEYDVVALIEDLPEKSLMAGSTGTILMIFGDGIAYEVEFMGATVDNPTGDDVYSSTLVTLNPDQIRLTWRQGIIPP